MANIPPPSKAKPGKGAPPPPDRVLGNLEKPELAVVQQVKAEPKELAPLNFKVSAAFKRDFKVFAAQNGLSLVALLKEGFEAYKAKSDN